MNFEESEQSLFKHGATYKAKSGELIATSIRIVFIPTDPSHEGKTLTWSNIVSAKYSPPDDKQGRAMIRIKTALQGADDVIFQLVGNVTKDVLFGQLEKLKLIVAQNKSAPVPPKSITPKVVTVANTSDDAVKQRVLTAQPALAKQYQDLVVTNKVISDVDFWKSHADLLQEYSTLSTFTANTTNTGTSYAHQNSVQKGRHNSLLDDVMESSGGGKVKVALTAEKKANIFLIYPAVKRAFDAEVPLRHTEVDFWRLYFQSEYFNSSTESEHNASTHDDLISRYAEKDDMRLVGPSVSGGMQTNKTTAGHETGLNKLHTKINAEIDLTSTYGDYHSSDVTSGTASDQTIGPNFTRIAGKYNKNGVIVVSGNSTQQNNTGDNHQLSELLNTAQSNYTAIDLHGKTHAHNNIKTESTAVDDTNTTNITTNDTNNSSGFSAFGSNSAFGASTMRIKQQTQQSEQNSGFSKAPAVANINKREGLKSTTELTTSLKDAFPTSNRAEQVLANEMKNMRSGHTTTSTTTSLNTTNNSNNKKGGSGIVDLTIDSTLKGPRFEQEMLESFCDITELLRHFYSILNRQGDSAPLNGNASALKAEAIVRRLEGDAGKKLETKKRKIQEVIASQQQQAHGGGGSKKDPTSSFTLVSTLIKPVSSHVPSEYDSSLYLIEESLDLVRRASGVWSAFNSDGGGGK